MDESSDLTQSLQSAVLNAITHVTPLNINGGNSKAFYGWSATGEPICLSDHRGIIQYEPTELVITARAGTPLQTLETVLAAQNQMLAFEPPHFGASATLGGTVACGISGPRRPFAGSVRDAVLGVKIINGFGEVLNFGGQVIKNVAGFDVARLMVGAMGTLGLLLEVSLRVQARPEAEETLVYTLNPEQALEMMSRWARQPIPLSAACYVQGSLYLRLSGAEAALKASREKLGGQLYPAGHQLWTDLREQQLAFFQIDTPLWRLSLPPSAPLANLPGESLLDWCGVLRWLKTDAPAPVIFDLAQQLGGHASLFRPNGIRQAAFQPLSPAMMALQQKVKQAFDPKGIFNRGRLYPQW